MEPTFLWGFRHSYCAKWYWFYLGTPIGRFELVKLFSSILKIEDGKYFLVTPVEKVGIQVDDAPFIAVDFNEIIIQGEKALKFETHVGDRVVASRENPIRVERDAITDEPAPYIHIRNGLDALIDRKTFYRLIDIGQHRNHENEAGSELFLPPLFFRLSSPKSWKTQSSPTKLFV